MNKFYRLDENKKAIPCELHEWANNFENDENRIIMQEDIGPIKCSTVFLGLDHSYKDGPPLIFETMIFGGEHDDYQTRCSTYEEALEMHKVAINLIKGTK